MSTVVPLSAQAPSPASLDLPSASPALSAHPSSSSSSSSPPSSPAAAPSRRAFLLPAPELAALPPPSSSSCAEDPASPPPRRARNYVLDTIPRPAGVSAAQRRDLILARCADACWELFNTSGDHRLARAASRTGYIAGTARHMTGKGLAECTESDLRLVLGSLERRVQRLAAARRRHAAAVWARATPPRA